MTPFHLTRALPIALAAAGLTLAAHGAQAAPNDDVAHVHVVGRLPLRDACPAVDTRDLADELVDAWEAAPKPSSVEVDFKLQRRHVYDVQPATDLPRVYHLIRHAVRFVVRFVDGDAGARVATITEADDAAGR